MTTLEDAALSKLRHLYKNMVSGSVKDASQAKRIAEGLLSPAIAALESRNAEVEALRGQLTTARNRLEDVLANDDGQAWKEARKFLEATQAQDTPKATTKED